METTNRRKVRKDIVLFKSYYVVWKRLLRKKIDQGIYRLNRTM